jgi:hypothetical protein
MSLREQLAQLQPRDSAGALSADRFEYQRNWALCHLLSLHQNENDYVMTFDHHEDVTVLDCEEAPTTIRAFQIKTKQNGNWTIRSLLKQHAGATESLPSILGKLCSIYQKFPSYVILLQVVSNAPFKLKLASDSKSHGIWCR